MKSVKSALLGNKQLIDTNNDVLIVQLREIIKEHRSLVITRLMNDLPTYLRFKFEAKPDKDTIIKIKESLFDLKNGGVDLKVYDNIVQQLLNRAIVHLTNEPIYKEIDELLSSIVATKELKLV
ncbi:MAG: hypothetical protein OJF59_002840 [Cytophagales bacterium]|jgi:hypothetical protein|nr:hypothetical protein [Bacteroidota bacterium]MBS1981765.1 hypothetical protein [Bacteroidota bacterium]WHZ09085.1 MAG: hypothetical protein OJF59_002840 [Cytophagales bacterium]